MRRNRHSPVFSFIIQITATQVKKASISNVSYHGSLWHLQCYSLVQVGVLQAGMERFSASCMRYLLSGIRSALISDSLAFFLASFYLYEVVSLYIL